MVTYPNTTQTAFKLHPKENAACDPGINEPCNVKCMINKVTYFYCLKTTMVDRVLYDTWHIHTSYVSCVFTELDTCITF